MTDQEQHEMVLQEIHLSGAEQWYCPKCGRKMLVKWEPKFTRIVMEAGDDFATHSGSKGGLQLGSAPVTVVDIYAQEIAPPLNEEFRLTPWEQWLEEVGFENLWDNED